MANLSSTRIFGDGTVERSLYVKQRLGVGVGNPSAKLDVDGILKCGGIDVESRSNNNHINVDGSFYRTDGQAHITVDDKLYIRDQQDGPSSAGGTFLFETDQNEIRVNGSTVWHAGNDGAGSGLDADTLDGVEGSSYARTDQRDTYGSGVELGGSPQITTTGNPDEFLEFGTDSTLSGDKTFTVQVDDDGSRANSSIRLRVGGSEFVRMTNDGHTGFGGETNPSYAVDVNGTGNFTGDLYASGNVGIGTSSPNDPLDVFTSGFTQIAISSGRTSGNLGALSFYDGNGNRKGTIHARGGGGFHIGNDNNRDYLSIDGTNGNVGIGTTSPDEELHIASSGPTLYLNNTNDVNYDLKISARYDFDRPVEFEGYEATPFLTQESGYGIVNIWTDGNRTLSAVSGQVGIGTTSPDAKLDVNGTIYADGDVIAYYSSDRRLKDNATQIQNPMSKIENFTGVGFDWKEEASRDGSGFGIFAQDAKKIDERLVRKQGDGYLGVDYQQLHGIEIEALKQVNEKVEENQSEIQRLKQRIAKLESNDNAI